MQGSCTPRLLSELMALSAVAAAIRLVPNLAVLEQLSHGFPQVGFAQVRFLGFVLASEFCGPDTAGPMSTIEKIPAPTADDLDEEEFPASDDVLEEQEIEEVDPATVDPSELAQHAAMDGGYFDGPIPNDILVPSGLSPKRAELFRFIEWRRQTVAELEHLEEAHHRAVEALGGERTTKRKIDALIEADIGEVLKFALGGEAITATKLRAFERHQLEQKLKDDQHAAQVASQTLGQIEHQIDIKTRALRFLDNRFQRYVKSAVVEAARESDLGDLYVQKIGELREVMMQLLGLGSFVGSTDRFYRDIPNYAEFKVELPVFGLPALAGKNLTIAASKQDLETAASPWRELASQLAKNPKAEAGVGQSA